MTARGRKPGFVRAERAPRVERVPSEGWVGIFMPERELPMVALRLLVRAGSWEDPEGQEGLAYLTGQLLLEGTERRSASAIHEVVDAMGGALFVDCTRDYTLLGMNVLRRELDAAVELLVELLREPSFPTDELRKKRDGLKGEIASQEDRPGGVAHRAFLEALFGKGGYGHEPVGYQHTLDGMERPDVRGYYDGQLRRKEVVLVAVGDLRVSTCARRVEGLLTGWQGTGTDAHSVDLPRPLTGGSDSRIVVHREIPQATVILGQPSLPRAHPDVYRLMVMNYILGGGGFDSRILDEIRSKRGLAYSAYSAFEPGLHGGIFRVGFQTRNESVQEALSLALEVSRRLQRRPVSDGELEGAKRYLVGSFPLRLDSNSSIASSLAMWECYGLGMAYPIQFAQAIEGVTRQAVQRVAQEHLDPDHWAQVIVGDRNAMDLDKVS